MYAFAHIVFCAQRGLFLRNSRHAGIRESLPRSFRSVRSDPFVLQFLHHVAQQNRRISALACAAIQRDNFNPFPTICSVFLSFWSDLKNRAPYPWRRAFAQRWESSSANPASSASSADPLEPSIASCCSPVCVGETSRKKFRISGPLAIRAVKMNSAASTHHAEDFRAESRHPFPVEGCRQGLSGEVYAPRFLALCFWLFPLSLPAKTPISRREILTAPARVCNRPAVRKSCLQNGVVTLEHAGAVSGTSA